MTIGERLGEKRVKAFVNCIELCSNLSVGVMCASTVFSLGAGPPPADFEAVLISGLLLSQALLVGFL